MKKKLIISFVIVCVLALSVGAFIAYRQYRQKQEKERQLADINQLQTLGADVYFERSSLKGLDQSGLVELLKTDKQAKEILPAKLEVEGLEPVPAASETSEMSETEPEEERESGDKATATEAESSKKMSEEPEIGLYSANIGLAYDVDAMFTSGLQLTKEIERFKVTKQTGEEGDQPSLAACYAGLSQELKQAVEFADGKFKLKPVLSYDKTKLDKEIAGLEDLLLVEPIQPQAEAFDPENEQFIFDQGQLGRALDGDDLKQQVAMAIETGRVDKELTAKFKELKPDPKVAEELQGKLTLVAQATTYLPYYDANRNGNIRVASNRLNGSLIKPHSKLSLLDVIGEMTAANGYFEAFAEVDGVAVKDVGGGLCQVSTTLFQAAAKADLDFAEYHNHGLVSAYAKPGLDCMIDHWADLVISNDTDYPYAIACYFDDNEVTYYVYGPPVADGATIELVPEHLGYVEPPSQPIREVDKSLPAGSEKLIRSAVTGQKTQTWRVYYVDGEEVRSEVLVTGYYEAYASKYKVGPPKTGKEPQPSDTPPEATTPVETAPEETSAPTESEEPAA